MANQPLRIQKDSASAESEVLRISDDLTCTVIDTIN